MAAETDHSATSEETKSDDERDEQVSVDDRDDAPRDDTEELSQEELAERDRREKEQQEAESKRKAGPIIMVASLVLAAIGLTIMFQGTSVQGNHPLASNGLLVLGLANLALALVIGIRKNWPRALVLTAMPVTIFLLFLTLTVVPMAVSLVAIVLCVVEIYVMFRQPILDEFDAPKE